jgi:hypothetical protein
MGSGTRQVTSIVVMGVLALLALAGMASYGISKSPGLVLKLAIERDFAVGVTRCEVLSDPARGRPELVIGVAPSAPLAATAAAHLATRIALASVAGADPEIVADPLEFGAVTVEVAGAAAPARFERALLERWRRIEPLLPRLAADLAPRLGAGTALSLYAGERGILDLEVRPGRPDIEPRAAAKAVTELLPAFGEIRVVPQKGAGKSAEPRTFPAQSLR